MESGQKYYKFTQQFLSFCSLHSTTLHTQTQNKCTATIRHAAHMQGDFGCRAPDGEAAALLQPELTRSDSGLMCHTPTSGPRSVVPAALRAVVLCVAAGLLTLP